MKTYGKEPESLDSITDIFLRDLAAFPIEKIMLAIKTHSQKSQEFPTVSDIYGLIKRNGKPPLTESGYIAITRKDGQDRTDADWQYMRDYEAERDGGWGGEDDAVKLADVMKENQRLRARLKELHEENYRLAEIARSAATAPAVTPKEISAEQRIDNTLAMMKATGATLEDQLAFLESVGRVMS